MSSMLDEFYNDAKELKYNLENYSDLRIRKNFTNAVDECIESLESALNVAGKMFMHNFFTFNEYNKFSDMAINSHINYLNYIISKLPD